MNNELMRMHWHSRDNLDYRGWMQVQEREGKCEVTINLTMESTGDQETDARFQRLLRDPNGSIQNRLEEALGRIKEICESGVQAEKGQNGARLL